MTATLLIRNIHNIYNGPAGVIDSIPICRRRVVNTNKQVHNALVYGILSPKTIAHIR